MENKDGAFYTEKNETKGPPCPIMGPRLSAREGDPYRTKKRGFSPSK